MIQETTAISFKTIGPALTSIASFLFGLPLATVLAGFAGSWMAVAMNEKGSIPKSLLAIGAGTVVAGYITPAAIDFIFKHAGAGDPSLLQRPICAAIGFCAIHKPSREWLIEKVKSWFSK